MEHPPSTSSLLQLIDALNRCVDAEHHTRLISDALEHAGAVNIPNDRDAFRAFVSSSLQEVTTTLLGASVATELVWTLMRMTSVRAPSSRAPGAGARLETAEYTDEVFEPRADVLVVGRETALVGELRIHLEARGYRLDHSDDREAVEREPPPRTLVTNLDLEEGLRCATAARRHFGTRAPAVVVLTDDSFLPDPPAGVDCILSASAAAPVVTAVLKILNPRKTDPIKQA